MKPSHFYDEDLFKNNKPLHNIINALYNAIDHCWSKTLTKTQEIETEIPLNIKNPSQVSSYVNDYITQFLQAVDGGIDNLVKLCRAYKCHIAVHKHTNFTENSLRGWI